MSIVVSTYVPAFLWNRSSSCLLPLWVLPLQPLPLLPPARLFGFGAFAAQAGFGAADGAAIAGVPRVRTEAAPRHASGSAIAPEHRRGAVARGARAPGARVSVSDGGARHAAAQRLG
ncbi:hypothetical protein QLQ97_31970, partial [Burkholderia pseudomallei]|nr:hypothetical protein [Burkholderia pseudomallei]